jgi:hypothetical protein
VCVDRQEVHERRFEHVAEADHACTMTANDGAVCI